MASKVSASYGTTSSIGSSSGNPLDCVIIDLELGKEPTDLRAPSKDSISMTTLSSESLVPTPITPRKWREDGDGQYANFDLARTSDPHSDRCSSIYSKRSSVLAETNCDEITMSSFQADDILMPKPLNLSRSTSANPAIANDTGSEMDDGVCSTAAVLLGPLRPKPAVKSETSSDSESEALVKEIVRHPMVETSPVHRLTQRSSQSGYLIVNQKAAKLLGLDGASSPATPTRPIFSEALKDIANKEPTSSPRKLRTIASKLSLSGRKKSPRQENERTALGKIEEQVPSKLPKMKEETEELSEASGSISRRRGFRPLSIHTGKAFDPFRLEGGSKPDRKEIRPSSNGPEMIEGDFATLISFTPPNITHHPVFQSDPFSATSPNPLLKTTSSPLQIRESKGRISLDLDSSGVSNGVWKRSGGGSKDKFFFDSGLKAPNNRDGPGADPLDLMLGGSPLPRTRPCTKPRNSLSYALVQNSETRDSAASDINAAPVDSTHRGRGISSRFKQRNKSAERSNKESGSAKSNSECDAAREAQVGFTMTVYNQIPPKPC